MKAFLRLRVLAMEYTSEHSWLQAVDHYYPDAKIVKEGRGLAAYFNDFPVGKFDKVSNYGHVNRSISPKLGPIV